MSRAKPERPKAFVKGNKYNGLVLGGSINNYLARSLQHKPKSEWETLDEHSREVARRCAAFAAQFDSEKWGELIGLLHDIGKASPQWQRYLEQSSAGQPCSVHPQHSIYGACHAVSKYGDGVGRVLAYIIAGHHAGLSDWQTAESGENGLKYKLLTRASNTYLRIANQRRIKKRPHQLRPFLD